MTTCFCQLDQGIVSMLNYRNFDIVRLSIFSTNTSVIYFQTLTGHFENNMYKV